MLEGNNCAHDFNTKLLSSGFANVITTPTRITCSTSSMLDLIITNVDTEICNAGTVACDISDHCPTFLTYRIDSAKNVKKETFFVQRITEERLESFKNEMLIQNWSSVLEHANANEAYNEFINRFVCIYAKHFPLQTITPSKKSKKPWVTREHLKMIKTKNRHFHSFLRTRSEQTLKEFKVLRNQLNSELRRAKSVYYEQLFADCARQRPDAAWKAINTILGRKNKSSLPDTLTHEGCELSGKALADYLNNHFVNIAVRHDYPPGTTPQSNSTINTIYLQPTDEQEIYNTFMSLRNSKALDIENIQVIPIKYVLTLITSVLSYIFNLVLELGVFPDKMKCARVSVIFKGGDPNLATNYRPISVLPIFSKALEKIIFSRIAKFFDKENIITNAQFGFRKDRSTETALLTLKEDILHNIENNLFSLAVFIDFSKAFDCLDHNILLAKIQAYGVRGTCLALLRSYLSNRFQKVFVKNSSSSLLPIKNGVPQGSVLGPLLFNTYINDLVNIDKTVKFVIYADDSTLVISGSNIDNLLIHCNEVLAKLSTWSKLNRLQINSSKTKVIIFRAKNKLVKLSHTINFECQQIEVVDHHKILGVYFSSHLTWDTHVDHLRKTLSSITGVISRCRGILPPKIKLQIYHALFNSNLRYCSLVWCTTTKTNISKLLVLQKQIIRYIANIEQRETTKNAFKSFNIINVEKLYEFRLLHSVYFSSTAVVNLLASLASLERRSINVETRNTDTWAVPHFRTFYKYQSLTHNLPTTLNKYRHTNNLNKKQLHSYFVHF